MGQSQQLMQQVSSQVIDKIACGECKECFVIFKYDKLNLPLTSLSNILQFEVKEVDAETGEVELTGDRDQYQIEDIDVTIADFMVPIPVNLEQEWPRLPFQRVETFNLALSSLSKAISVVSDLFGCQVVSGAQLASSSSTTHVMGMSGMLFGVDPILIRVTL